MRILISAYACEPGKGSEPGAGYAALLAALSEHEVWIVTRSNNVPALESELAGHPQRDRLRIVGYDLGRMWSSAKRRLGSLGTLLYYDAWQRGVSRVLSKLDDSVDFDVVHHATFATHWARIGAAAVGKPLVIGPVGGAGRTPFVLWPALGLLGIAAEVARRVIRPAVAVLVRSRSTLASAAVVLAQNPMSLGSPSPAKTVLPNGLIGAGVVDSVPLSDSDPFRLVGVGRLIGLKGYSLAIEAMEHLADTAFVLHLYGEGVDRKRLERRVRRRKLVDRVTFHGQVDRAEALVAISSSAALLHPAFHEESSVTVGEALALGTPVVCMDLAGPPQLLDRWPGVPSRRIEPGRPHVVAERIARAIREVAGRGVARNDEPGRQFTAELLAAYESAVGS